MLQAIFTLRRKGFNKKIKVGEIFNYKDEKYVLTHIVEIKHFYSSSARMEVEGVAQLVGGKSDFSQYERTSEFVCKYPKGEFSEENPLYRVGDIFVFDGICGEVTNIESIEYEFVDLVVTYHSRLFRPWSDEEMSQAVKEDRLSKFKVIG